MLILKKSAWLNKSQAARASRVLTSHGYTAIDEGYASNIMAHLGGADISAQQEVYEMISYALGYDLVDAEGFGYIPEWL